MSYSLYLTHAPVLELVRRYVVKPCGLEPILALGALMVCSVPATVIVAIGFYWVAERHFIKRPWERIKTA